MISLFPDFDHCSYIKEYFLIFRNHTWIYLMGNGQTVCLQLPFKSIKEKKLDVKGNEYAERGRGREEMNDKANMVK